MSYGVRVVAGAGRHFEEYASLLEAELTSVGLGPKRDIEPVGPCFKLRGGFGCRAVVYFKRAGNDVIVTPEVRRSAVGIVIPVLLLCLLILPGVILLLWVRRNVRKTLAKVLHAIESSVSEYEARYPAGA